MSADGSVVAAPYTTEEIAGAKFRFGLYTVE